MNQNKLSEMGEEEEETHAKALRRKEISITPFSAIVTSWTIRIIQK